MYNHLAFLSRKVLDDSAYFLNNLPLYDIEDDAFLDEFWVLSNDMIIVYTDLEYVYIKGAGIEECFETNYFSKIFWLYNKFYSEGDIIEMLDKSNMIIKCRPLYDLIDNKLKSINGSYIKLKKNKIYEFETNIPCKTFNIVDANGNVFQKGLLFYKKELRGIL